MQSPCCRDLKEKKPEELKDTFDKFYSNQHPITSVKITSYKELINTSFVIGEKHTEISSTNFLISNMAKLKEAGFSTIFSESFFYDQKNDLDDYCLNPNTKELSDELINHLKRKEEYNKPLFRGAMFSKR